MRAHPSEVLLVEGISRAPPTVVDPTDISSDANQATNSIAFLTPIHSSITSGIESSGEKGNGAKTPPSLLLPPPIDRGLLFKGFCSAHDRSVNRSLRAAAGGGIWGTLQGQGMPPVASFVPMGKACLTQS